MMTPTNLIRALLTVLALCALDAQAGVLPEDRADLGYHVYQGDGIVVQGPALLVRKKFGESVSTTATYDIDSVTGASIDSRTSGASSLKERRVEWSPTVTYMRGKSTYNVTFSRSKETDYLSDNYSFGISEDMFGDLTTVTLGYTRGKDDISRNDQVRITPMGKADRRNYRLGLSQILTKKLVLSVDYESSGLEGYLQNPYRKVRYGTANSLSAAFQDEKYPRTRTSNAISIGARYYLPYRASIKADYRYFTDSWGIVAHTGDLEYVQPIGAKWTLEGSARYYTQSRADFYADLFPFIDAQNFLARDKVLSTFNDWSVRLGGSWRWVQGAKFYGVVSLFVDHIQYTYEDFRDATVKNVAVGKQPLFSFGANVYQAQYTQHF